MSNRQRFDGTSKHSDWPDGRSPGRPDGRADGRADRQTTRQTDRRQTDTELSLVYTQNTYRTSVDVFCRVSAQGMRHCQVVFRIAFDAHKRPIRRTLRGGHGRRCGVGDDGWGYDGWGMHPVPWGWGRDGVFLRDGHRRWQPQHLLFCQQNRIFI